MSVTITKGTRSVASASDVYACYRCSCCANPVIARLTVESIQSGSTSKVFGVSESELQQQAQTEKEKLYAGLTAFLAEPKEDTFPQGGVAGLDEPCPFCGSLEPWQSAETLWKASASGPIEIRQSLKDGYGWAQKVLRARKEAAEKAQSDPAVQQQNRQRLQEIEEELAACDREKTSGQAAKEAASLAEKAAGLKKELDAMGLFSKGKKQVKEELDQCEQALAGAQDKQKGVSQQMDIQAARLKREQAELTLLDKAYEDRAVYREGARHLALRLCEEQEQPEAPVSLQELPKVQRYAVSQYETKNREQLEQNIAQLNETLQLARGQKEEA